MAANPKFTLRFHDAGTHELLGVLAERRGVSKNHLAEEMLERELHAAAPEPLRTRMVPAAAAFDAFGIADTFSGA